MTVRDLVIPLARSTRWHFINTRDAHNVLFKTSCIINALVTCDTIRYGFYSNSTSTGTAPHMNAVHFFLALIEGVSSVGDVQRSEATP